MIVSLEMMFGRLGSLLGNIFFPALMGLGCVPPFLMISAFMLGKFIEVLAQIDSYPCFLLHSRVLYGRIPAAEEQGCSQVSSFGLNRQRIPVWFHSTAVHSVFNLFLSLVDC